MEFWSFPPSYDESYFPGLDSRYWFKERETMPAGLREKAILERLRLVCSYAYENAPFYKRKWDEAGFHPTHLISLEDFERDQVCRVESRLIPFALVERSVFVSIAAYQPQAFQDRFFPQTRGHGLAFLEPVAAVQAGKVALVVGGRK